MSDSARPLYRLSTQPNLAEVARRYEAFMAGDIIDRPLLTVTAPLPGAPTVAPITYRDRQFGDIDEIYDRVLASMEHVYYAGEAIPSYAPSFGCDEIAVWCGLASFGFHEDSSDTCWSWPTVEDWDAVLPIRLHREHPLWQRMLRFYERGAERLAGKVLLSPPDLHTNMDLLMAARGSERLCADLLDRPEVIDRAMVSARAVFRELWDVVVRAGKLDERGISNGLYSMEGAAVLSCDFSYMISPAMFRRWVLPALLEESETVKHMYYHWDGPGALVHFDALMSIPRLHAVGYVPPPFERHSDYIELYKRVQAAGKGVHVWGLPDEMKRIHKELRPEKTMYSTWVDTPAEADAVVEWFVKNT
jgi:5-methyltetrahydrofolate--homocysteine methyltransferase